jgi:hypothetical protein
MDVSPLLTQFEQSALQFGFYPIQLSQPEPEIFPQLDRAGWAIEVELRLSAAARNVDMRRTVAIGQYRDPQP